MAINTCSNHKLTWLRAVAGRQAQHLYIIGYRPQSTSQWGNETIRQQLNVTCDADQRPTNSIYYSTLRLVCLVGFRFDKTNEEISWPSHVATSEEVAGWGASPWQPWTNGSARSAPLSHDEQKTTPAKSKWITNRPTDRQTDGRTAQLCSNLWIP